MNNAVSFDGYWITMRDPYDGPVGEQNASFDAYWEQYRRLLNENECPHEKNTELPIPSGEGNQE